MSQAARVPEKLLMPTQEFKKSYTARASDGLERLSRSSVAFVGLARNCSGPLVTNLSRILALANRCREWRLHVETNDNSDSTSEVLAQFCSQYPQASYREQSLARPHLPGEFAGPRTVALAEYRAACQRWVRDHAADADYVCVLDMDAWGSFWIEGVLNGVGWLVELPGAFAMASVSLTEVELSLSDSEGNQKKTRSFVHYDAWALRGVGQPDTYYDDYTHNEGMWKHHWLPPVGSEPVSVASAFGGFAVYRTDAYLAGTYEGTTDCEHVMFHRSIAAATGQRMFLCPGMRTVMQWLEADDGGLNSQD
jgi:hypothetical protein